MPKNPSGPIPTPWDETGLDAVDVSSMGGELTPFYPNVDALGRIFTILDILQHVDTEYGARMFVHVTFRDDPEKKWTLTFTEKAPVHAQLTTLAEASESIFPIGPVSLFRQGKSYRIGKPE